MRKLLLFTLIAAGAAGAAPLQKSAPACSDGLHLWLTDALGDPVVLGAPDQRRVTIVVFMSRGAKEEAAGFLRTLDEKLLNGPVESLGVVDLRKYGGLTRDLAQWRLKR